MGTRRLTWVDLLAVIRHSPPDSALARETHGEITLWSPDTWLLALVADLLAGANWQRANEGRRTPRPQPKPVPRPTDKAIQLLTTEDLRGSVNPLRSGVIGTARTVDEIKEWLVAKNGR